MRKFLKPLSFLPALFLMYMIFSFSAQEGEVSAALSYKVSYKIVETADHILDAGLESWEMESLANRFHGVTRKLAHMTEYFALAIAVAFPLYVYGMHGILLMVTAGLICVAFACGDEYHQSFVAGRSPSRRDVLIDSFGIFWGIIVVRIVGWTGRKTIFRPLKKKKSKKEKRMEAQMREEEAMAREYQRAQHERNANYGYQRTSYGPEDNYGYSSPGQNRMNSARPQQRPDNIPSASVYPPPQRPPYSKTSFNAGRNAGAGNPKRKSNTSRTESRQNSAPQTHSHNRVPYSSPDYEGAYYGTDSDYRGYPASDYQDYDRNPDYENPYPSYTNGMYTQEDLAEAHISDKLSEDMSFRKLMHNLKDQRHREQS